MIEQILEKFAHFDREKGGLIAREQLQEWPDESVTSLRDSEPSDSSWLPGKCGV